MKITTKVEITWEIETPKDEAAKQKIRAAISEKVNSDLNEYWQNDEEASMVTVEIKEYGI